jgi:hypothetical protein
MALLNGFVPKTFRLSLRVAALDDPLTASGDPAKSGHDIPAGLRFAAGATACAEDQAQQSRDTPGNQISRSRHC